MLRLLPFVLAFAVQSSSLLKPAAIQHVTAATSTTSDVVAPGGKTTLVVDVTPDRNIHVYAPGAKDFIATSIKMTAKSGVTFGTAAYPPSEMILDPILNERIPEYTKTFRITQPVTLSAQSISGESVTMTAVLTYQACDDKMCFAPSELPVQWTVRVK
jgi:Disulphide bond corrector protein DsbC